MSSGRRLIHHYKVGVKSTLFLAAMTALVYSQSNGIRRYLWNGISGVTVSNLTSNSNYPHNPSSSSTVSNFEGPTQSGDNYGCRYRGFIVPPTTGTYTFWIASDDYSELWLSTSSDTSSLSRIAYVNGYCDSRQWTKYSSQQSAGITLQAGRHYYIEALHKEGSQNDNLAVGWQGPGITGDAERPIPNNRLRLWTGTRYTLTVNNDGHGTTSPSGAVTATAGVSISIGATPAAGYQFSNWTVTSGSASITNANSASTEVTLWNSNATIQANFTAVNYTLTVTNDGHGTTNPSGSITVGHGVPQAISATAASGYRFLNWTVTSGTATIADPSSASTTVTLTSGNATIRANFTVSTYNLTVTNDGHGTTNPSGTVAVQPGVPQAISATAASGYRFLNWTVISGTASIADSTSASTTVTLTSGNATIRANFALLTYSLTVTNDGHGTTNPSGTVTVSHGVPQAINASAASGYVFLNWTVTGGSASIADPASAATTVTLTSGNATIRANFTAVTYILTITNDGHGTTIPSGAVPVADGVPQPISAVASSGYVFSQWTVVSGTASIAAPNAAATTVTLTSGNATIRADFSEAPPIQPNNRRIAITGTLSDANGVPVGSSGPVTIAVEVNIYTSAQGGSPVYTERFLPQNNHGVTVEDGYFVVTLGTGVFSTDLASVLAANENCYAQITILDETPDTLHPRTPVTAAAYALGTAGVTGATAELHGSGTPEALNVSAKTGTFYIDDSNGTTWIKIKSGWRKLD